MSVLVDTIVMLGMLVAIPAGLRLTGAPELDRIRRLWPLFAAPGADSTRTAPTRTVPFLTDPFPTDHGGRTS
ncbi:hypothetical protein [Streptomyces sp. NPDC056227]|uniref:hypothetical protein n=1 Tax=Streptomyces sp. NPDC056227 TaxID=3345753 RepID=UPI0035D5AA32